MGETTATLHDNTVYITLTLMGLWKVAVTHLWHERSVTKENLPICPNPQPNVGRWESEGACVGKSKKKEGKFPILNEQYISFVYYIMGTSNRKRDISERRNGPILIEQSYSCVFIAGIYCKKLLKKWFLQMFYCALPDIKEQINILNKMKKNNLLYFNIKCHTPHVWAQLERLGKRWVDQW